MQEREPMKQRRMTAFQEQNDKAVMEHNRHNARLWLSETFCQEEEKFLVSPSHALQRLRSVRADCRATLLCIYRHITQAGVRDTVLYELLISRSVLDFRILYSLCLIDVAKRLRGERFRQEFGMLLHPRSRSRFLDMEPEIVKRILEIAGI